MELSDMHYSKKRKYRYPAKSRRIWIMISVLLVSCCILDLIYYKKVQDGLLEQTYSDLKKESNIARGNLESRLQAKQEWLEMIAAFCDIPDGSGTENWWDKTRQFCSEDYRLEMGDTQGNIYYGDHQSGYVGDKPYYREIIAGKRSISGIQSMGYQDQDSIVVGVPIFRDGKVEGAVCAEYTVSSLGNLINGSEMSQYGANLVFTPEGKLAASYSGMEHFETVFEMLETMEYKKQGEVRQFRKSTREAALQMIQKEFGKKDGGNYRVCMFLDIDHFKEINDTYGHDAGDRVLIESGAILKRCLRNTDIVSRYGGDEFCIWVYGEADSTVLVNIANRILGEFRKIGSVSVSIGIAAAKQKESDYLEVLKRADQALYKAKRQGRNQYVLDYSKEET
ncbi:sensor domain-containing diguanylate cyclase [Blautia producta]|uniref:sensor domain-containing diguanylate cyclase n=1 Tax=Blautia producta TaxID=33035 RepID=UPI00210C6E6B|nr:sensor domain-containing diguanylate cyclase [Blautia producta]MCQ4745993.1 sensor domain-containing diguanylate cyclase [Blautia producta]